MKLTKDTLVLLNEGRQEIEKLIRNTKHVFVIVEVANVRCGKYSRSS